MILPAGSRRRRGRLRRAGSRRALLGMALLLLPCAAAYKAARLWVELRDPYAGVLPPPDPAPCLAGYVDRMVYAPGDTVRLRAAGPASGAAAELVRLGTAGSRRTLARFDLRGLRPRPGSPDAVSGGAGWPVSASLPLPRDLKCGYHALLLRPRAGTGGAGPADTAGFLVPILVRDPARKAPLALFANVSTWTAYNEWGGASLYRRLPGAGLPHFVSAARPNLAVQGPAPRHDLGVEAHVFGWLDSAYGCALFADPELGDAAFDPGSARILALPYHPEYFSDAMHARLRREVFARGRSLLYLGGNGIYHKVRWHRAAGGTGGTGGTVGPAMECRKDMSPFAGGWSLGGLWKWSLHPGQTLLGVRYTDAGYGSLAPYRVEAAGHWLWAGTGVEAGAIFGAAGFDGRPLSGHETDKSAWLAPPGAVRLARGLNPAAGPGRVHPDPGVAWTGEGGAHLVYFRPTDSSGALACGSLRCGAGLGSDPVFTRLVRNFVERHR